MTDLVVAPIAIAFATAILCVLGRGRYTTPTLSVTGVLAYAVAVIVLIQAILADPDGIVVYQLGNWTAPVGIVLVGDALSAFMLALTVPIAVAAVGTAVVHLDGRGQRLSFHALFHFMLVGITGAFLTGDIFNLFVWFEVMLMASYVLVVFYGGAEATREALRYVVLNLIGSAVMLIAIGGLYGVTGTLNMADLARRLAAPATYDIAAFPIVGLSALLFAVFALKAGAVPFQFWVPGAYRAAPTPVAAMLAAVTKKVGVYAIIRLTFTVLGASVVARESWAYFGPVLLIVGTGSVVIGGIGALRRNSFRGLLAYSSIGQVGFILLAVAAAALAPTEAARAIAITAALIYAFHHALAKGLLFLAAGAVTDAAGTDRFPELGGLAGRLPILSAAIFVAGLALVGIPPLMGFFGKFLVFDAAIRANAPIVLVVALLGAILTIAYVSLAWNRGFWGQASPFVERASADTVHTAIVVGLAVIIIAAGVGVEPLIAFAQEAAGAALDTDGYVAAVLGGEG